MPFEIDVNVSRTHVVDAPRQCELQKVALWKSKAFQSNHDEH